MKKGLLASAVVISFILYSLHSRNESAETSSVVAPSTMSHSATNVSMMPSSGNSYKDGAYTGNAADAIYGYIQVKAIISGGKLTDVEFLQYPNDRHTSVEINSQAMPLLKQEAIQAQTARVDGVSGATDTSQAFVQSIGDALSQARS